MKDFCFRLGLYKRFVRATAWSKSASRAIARPAAMVLLGLAIALSAWGDPTTLTISNASVTVTSSSSTTLNFPISRSGDTSYDAFVQYQTQDGTAVAGT